MASNIGHSTGTSTDVAPTEIPAVILKTGAQETLHVETADEMSRELHPRENGKIVLIPQPSDDPHDPLNWSWGKKHRVLVAVSIGALLADWGTAWGTTLFEVQAETWNSSVLHASNSIGGAVFLTGAAGLFAAPLTQRYGRLPILFWSQILAAVAVLAAALAPTYAGFTTARAFQGLFASPPQIIGLSMIHDMFFFHERTRKIGIWGFCFVTGPFLGPVVSSLLNKRLSWRANFGVLAGLFAASALLVVAFGWETLYDRDFPRDPEKKQGLVRKKFEELTGIAGYRAASRRPALLAVLRHLAVISIQPQLLVPAALFYMPTFMWSIGLVNTITQFLYPPPYSFNTVTVAMFYFAPTIGCVLGDLWGRWFNDFLTDRYIRTHDGSWKPEFRLWAIWPTTVIGVCALVLTGETLQHHLHWIGLAFGWGMFIFASLASTVAVAAYALDCYPHHAMLASSVLNFWRTTGGFTVIYYQIPWIEAVGPAATFGTQAAICAAAFVFALLTQIYGESWRRRYPPPVAEN